MFPNQTQQKAQAIIDQYQARFAKFATEYQVKEVAIAAATTAWHIFKLMALTAIALGMTARDIYEWLKLYFGETTEENVERHLTVIGDSFGETISPKYDDQVTQIEEIVLGDRPVFKVQINDGRMLIVLKRRTLQSVVQDWSRGLSLRYKAWLTAYTAKFKAEIERSLNSLQQAIH